MIQYNYKANHKKHTKIQFKGDGFVSLISSVIDLKEERKKKGKEREWKYATHVISVFSLQSPP